LRPSRGVEPTFGRREFEVDDGENRLYVLKLKGDVAAFLGRQKFETAGKCVVKVGHAKEPKDRCDTHNAHLPPACRFSWDVALTSKPFDSGSAAKNAEDGLKAAFEKHLRASGANSS
jgi:hypothetical protein